MSGLVRRELIAIARHRALWMMAATQAALLSAFLLAWGEGGLVPFLPGSNLYEQLRTIQLAFLAMAAPWAVCRVSADAPRDEWPWMALVSCAPPARLLVARLAALAAYFTAVLATALPPAVLAQQMAGLPASRVAYDLAASAVFLVSAAALTLHIVSWSRERLAPVMLSAVVVAAFCVLLSFTTSPAIALTASLAFAIVGTLGLAYRADRSLRFASGRAR
jgi:hypothetical protein